MLQKINLSIVYKEKKHIMGKKKGKKGGGKKGKKGGKKSKEPQMTAKEAILGYQYVQCCF